MLARVVTRRTILSLCFAAGSALSSGTFAQTAPEPESGPTDAPLTETPAPAPAPTLTPKLKSPVAAKPVDLIVEEAAVQILQQAADAIKELKSVSMKCNTGSTGGGVFERMAQKIEGSIMASRSPSDPKDWVVRATGSGAPRPTDSVIQFDCIWSGNEAQWIDHKDKKVMKRTLGGAKGIPYQLPMQLRPAGLFTADPLATQLACKEIKLEKNADAGGTLCDVVLVSNDGRRDRTRWYFAKSDHLPRKVEKVIESPMGSGTSYVEFGDIQINKDIPATALQMVTPEGYTSDENVAPVTKAEKRAAAEGSLPAVAVVKPNRAHPAEGAPSAEPGAMPDGTPTSGEPADAPTGEHAAPGTVHADTANMAPAFELSDLDGKPVSLASLKGRVVVLNFWGTWSPKAKLAHAELETLTAKFKDKNVAVLAPAVREKGKDALAQHVSSHNYTFKVLQDADKIAKAYKVATYPTTVVIDANGKLAGSFVGFTKDETFTQVSAAVEAALPVK